jgi:hypothetical protein
VSRRKDPGEERWRDMEGAIIEAISDLVPIRKRDKRAGGLLDRLLSLADEIQDERHTRRLCAGRGECAACDLNAEQGPLDCDCGCGATFKEWNLVGRDGSPRPWKVGGRRYATRACQARAGMRDVRARRRGGSSAARPDERRRALEMGTS